MNRKCMYCGKPAKKGRKGEHIIPAAIQGGLTLNDVSDRVVCEACNSGVLSQLDRELCSRSYLSIIASREIGAHLWQAWEVDHKSNNLLVEARPSWGVEDSLSSLVCYPQITFERSGVEVRGDADEFEQFGYENATKVLFRAARHCFARFRAGVKGAIHLERVRSGLLRTSHRLAPRLYAPHSIWHIAKNIQKQSFVLRYIANDDKRFALNSLLNLDDRCRARNWSRTLGSYRPSLCFFFDIGVTMRALLKMGLNLIAAFCPNTPVDKETFKLANRIIRDEAGQITAKLFSANGFVWPSDIETIKAPGVSHSFRLTYLDGRWQVFFSFFGGQVGARVFIPGPNHEDWKTADIVSPLGSKEWTVTKSAMILPLNAHVEWNDGKRIVPSFKLQNNITSILIEPARRRQPTTTSGGV